MYDILHPVLHKAFLYFLEGKYLAIYCDGDYVTIPKEHDVLACVFSEENVG